MNLLYINEHLNCYNYSKGNNPEVEVVRMTGGEGKAVQPAAYEIVFLMEGRIKFSIKDFPSYEGTKGEFVFFPAGVEYSFESMGNAMVLVFRLKNPISLCENFRLERLSEDTVETAGEQPRTERWISVLHTTPRIWHFLDGVVDCVSDGIKCRCYFEMKIKELLLLLRAYYRKEELREFFRLVLSKDIGFSEYVRRNWRRYDSVAEMAASMNLTHKQFFTRFVAVFGKTPQEWMMQGRAGIVLNEILSSKKQFKQIAIENGFSSDAQFTRFCKRTLGKSPTEIREGK